jgi:hypothetical protein
METSSDSIREENFLDKIADYRLSKKLCSVDLI